MNEINIIPIGSGSTGNCFYIEMEGIKFLVDMGIGVRKIKDVLAMHERDLSEVQGVFVTHGHIDHTKAAKAIASKISCNVYSNKGSMYPLRDIKAERVVLKPDEDTEILPGLTVRMFSVPHDYVQTSGYVFKTENRKLGFVTDCGKMNDYIIGNLEGSDVVIIEANHDVEMLKNGPYPKDLKRRILSVHGHLSNDDCADTVRRLYDSGTANFILAHISRENNTPETALNTVLKRLKGCKVSVYACHHESSDLLSYPL